MSDDYESVARGKLKLKSDSEIKKKKKKKSKDKDKEKIKEQIEKTSSEVIEIKNPEKSGRQLTNAEKSFKKMQEKMQQKRIMEKASLTHKQRVEKFNEHLDSLTEHFDIPKVSWTK